VPGQEGRDRRLGLGRKAPGSKRIAPGLQHHHGRGDDRRTGAQRPGHGLKPDTRPDQVDARHGRPERDGQADGKPRHIGAEAPGDEAVVGVFHAGEIVQADLPERPARHKAMHGRDTLAPGAEKRQCCRRRMILRRARGKRQPRSASPKARSSGARSAPLAILPRSTR
jgi:hypothetical protein